MAIVKLWGNKIIAGDREFKDVPASLKKKVAEYLIASGRPDLVTE